MRDIRHVVTHRCKELLEYNQNENTSFKPCAIHFDKWLLENEPRHWILKSLETDFDYDVTYMTNIAIIKHCPFCGEELKIPLTLVESEQE